MRLLSFIHFKGCQYSRTMDAFEILGIEPTDSLETIKKAWKQKAREVHPDQFPNATQSEKDKYNALMVQVNNAFYELRDPETRASILYDREYRGQTSDSENEETTNTVTLYYSKGPCTVCKGGPAYEFGLYFTSGQLGYQEIDFCEPCWRRFSANAPRVMIFPRQEQFQ